MEQKKTFKRHIPNALTTFNLLAGSLAIPYALQGNYTITFWLVMIAAFFDFFDGFAARLLKVISPFGQIMDSLADMVSFGVVPALTLYSMINNSLTSNAFTCTTTFGTIIPYTAFLIAVFSGLRLAKFHTDNRQTDAFIGLPTPANAILIASFAMTKNEMPEIFIDKLSCPYSLAGITLLLSFLLVAEIPMFSLKFHDYKIKNNILRYAFLSLSLIFLVLWKTHAIPLIILIYIIISIFFYKKR